ncbi:hypothetical protein SEA_RASPUTIA_130 [Microbacterium phage Rasputia]|nr:hypothetical protein SEA_RASPUTIA_130 [Microbacterium phage Rasputia]
MPITNYTTTMTVSKTLEATMKLLTKSGVRAIQTEYAQDGVPSGLSFIIDTEFGPRTFALPVRIGAVHATLIKQRVEPRYQKFEHATRVAWKIAHDWLRAQLALIEAGMSTTSETFFPYMVSNLDADGRAVTVYSEYTRSQREIER